MCSTSVHGVTSSWAVLGVQYPCDAHWCPADQALLISPIFSEQRKVSGAQCLSSVAVLFLPALHWPYGHLGEHFDWFIFCLAVRRRIHAMSNSCDCWDENLRTGSPSFWLYSGGKRENNHLGHYGTWNASEPFVLFGAGSAGLVALGSGLKLSALGQGDVSGVWSSVLFSCVTAL